MASDLKVCERIFSESQIPGCGFRMTIQAKIMPKLALTKWQFYPAVAGINQVESIHFRVVEIFEHDTLTRNITRENFIEYSYSDGPQLRMFIHAL